MEGKAYFNQGKWFTDVKKVRFEKNGLRITFFMCKGMDFIAYEVVVIKSNQNIAKGGKIFDIEDVFEIEDDGYYFYPFMIIDYAHYWPGDTKIHFSNEEVDQVDKFITWLT